MRQVLVLGVQRVIDLERPGILRESAIDMDISLESAGKSTATEAPDAVIRGAPVIGHSDHAGSPNLVRNPIYAVSTRAVDAVIAPDAVNAVAFITAARAGVAIDAVYIAGSDV